jgi:hypothetical protein
LAQPSLATKQLKFLLSVIHDLQSKEQLNACHTPFDCCTVVSPL